MTKLPQQIPWDKASIRWASIIEPVISNPLIQGHILKNVNLKVGVNTVPHKLGRKLIGWNTVRVRGLCQLYDEQDTSGLPELFLTLVSDADVSVDILVF